MTYSDTEVSVQESDYFVEGESFSLEDYNKQFVENGTLNNGLALGWTIHVDSIYPDGTGYGAQLTLTKSA